MGAHGRFTGVVRFVHAHVICRGMGMSGLFGESDSQAGCTPMNMFKSLKVALQSSHWQVTTSGLEGVFAGALPLRVTETEL
jgi:hypothetical protein